MDSTIAAFPPAHSTGGGAVSRDSRSFDGHEAVLAEGATEAAASPSTQADVGNVKDFAALLQRRKQLPSILIDSWEFRKIASEGSVLPNALVCLDVDGDNVEECIVGTTEGVLLVVKPDCRLPIFTHVLSATISVVLYSCENRRLVLVTLEGQCEVLDNFLVPPPAAEKKEADSSDHSRRPSNAATNGGSAAAASPATGPAPPRPTSHTSLAVEGHATQPDWYKKGGTAIKPTSVFHVPSNCFCGDIGQCEGGDDRIFLGSFDRRLYVYSIKGVCLFALFMHSPITSIKTALWAADFGDAEERPSGGSSGATRAEDSAGAPVPLVFAATATTIVLLRVGARDLADWRQLEARHKHPLTLADADALRQYQPPTTSGHGAGGASAFEGDNHSRRSPQQQQSGGPDTAPFPSGAKGGPENSSFPADVMERLPSSLFSRSLGSPLHSGQHESHPSGNNIHGGTHNNNNNSTSQHYEGSGGIVGSWSTPLTQSTAAPSVFTPPAPAPSSAHAGTASAAGRADLVAEDGQRPTSPLTPLTASTATLQAGGAEGRTGHTDRAPPLTLVQPLWLLRVTDSGCHVPPPCDLRTDGRPPRGDDARGGGGDRRHRRATTSGRDNAATAAAPQRRATPTGLSRRSSSPTASVTSNVSCRSATTDPSDGGGNSAARRATRVVGSCETPLTGGPASAAPSLPGRGFSSPFSSADGETDTDVGALLAASYSRMQAESVPRGMHRDGSLRPSLAMLARAGASDGSSSTAPRPPDEFAEAQRPPALTPVARRVGRRTSADAQTFHAPVGTAALQRPRATAATGAAVPADGILHSGGDCETEEEDEDEEDEEEEGKEEVASDDDEGAREEAVWRGGVEREAARLPIALDVSTSRRRMVVVVSAEDGRAFVLSFAAVDVAALADQSARRSREVSAMRQLKNHSAAQSRRHSWLGSSLSSSSPLTTAAGDTATAAARNSSSGTGSRAAAAHAHAHALRRLVRRLHKQLRRTVHLHRCGDTYTSGGGRRRPSYHVYVPVCDGAGAHLRSRHHTPRRGERAAAAVRPGRNPRARAAAVPVGLTIGPSGRTVRFHGGHSSSSSGGGGGSSTAVSSATRPATAGNERESTSPVVGGATAAKTASPPRRKLSAPPPTDDMLVLQVRCLWAGRLQSSPLVQRSRILRVADDGFCCVFVAANGTCCALDPDTNSAIEYNVLPDCSSFTLSVGPPRPVVLPPATSPAAAAGAASVAVAGPRREPTSPAATAIVGRSVSCVCVCVDEMSVHSIGDAFITTVYQSSSPCGLGSPTTPSAAGPPGWNLSPFMLVDGWGTTGLHGERQLLREVGAALMKLDGVLTERQRRQQQQQRLADGAGARGAIGDPDSPAALRAEEEEFIHYAQRVITEGYSEGEWAALREMEVAGKISL